MINELLEKAVFKFNNHNDIFFWNTDINKKNNNVFNYVEDVLLNHKKMIDNIPKHVWNYNKKLINDFETLHIPTKNMDANTGIAGYNPISRAFFKMWEIICDFELINNDRDDLIYGALCEGPGGFIEAFNYYRKMKKEIYRDTIVAMTLKDPENNYVPAWNKSNKVLKECKHIYITYGSDNTGNIYNIDNIKSYKNIFSNYKADLITADGGFDFSNDYDNQEQVMSHLIFAEIVTGLITLKVGGNMVIKIFDSFKHITIDIIYILCKYFNNIYITKPFTSRPLNSEKYIVCKGFIKCEQNDIDIMFRILDNMNNNNNIHRLLTNNIPVDFLRCIDAINIAFSFRQIRYMKKIFNIIKNTSIYKEIDVFQNEKVVYSLEWCKKYKFQINKNSIFLLKLFSD
jgi:23S rRNA U2552 (ribose-2'-O)-methylase RlmE/FtsJ